MERFIKYLIVFLAFSVGVQAYSLRGLQERFKAQQDLIIKINEELHPPVKPPLPDPEKQPLKVEK